MQRPGTLTGEERAGLEALIQRYPYFVPARLMEAGQQQSRQAFAPDMLERLALYRGNWLQFFELMQQAAHPAPEIQASPAEMPAAMDMTPEATDVSGAIPAQTTESAEPETTVLQEDSLMSAVSETYRQEQDALPPESPEQQAEALPAEPEEEEMKLPLQDYFSRQGISVSDELPGALPQPEAHEESQERKDEDKSLMVVMSFSEWLMHYKTQNQKAKEEEEDKRALKSMWQQEKLAAALEEEHDEIPESVFEMAVNSLAKEEDLASESLAEILIKQGKLDKAIEMYRKLSLRNPQKKSYFADKIDAILKDKEL